MVTELVDRFDRANDATGLGTNHEVELGNIQIVDEYATQQAGGSFAVNAQAYMASALDVASQRVAVFAELLGSTGDPFIEARARFRAHSTTSPQIKNTGYAARLTFNASGTVTLTIQKYLAGAATEKASINVTLGSPNTRNVPIQITVEDVKDGVEVRAFVDDLENAVLVFTDKVSPIFQQIGSAGFSLFEGTAQTNPQTRVHAFEAVVLDVEFEDGAEDERIDWTATKIINHIQLNVDRNSALSELSFNNILDFLNLTEMQFVKDVGPVQWLEREFTVRAAASMRFTRLPRQVSDQIVNIYDFTNKRMLAQRNKMDMDNRFRNRESSNGQPEVWIKVGREAGDRIQIELWPIPNADTTLIVFARANPGRMDENDYPLVPQDYVDGLIQGTIVKSGVATGNQNMMRIASAEYKRWVARARREDRNSRDIHIIPSRSLPRRFRPPVTRRDQRRFPFP